ncbi:NAD(P)-dependent oxidoreductase [Holophaga foetida]|uniref:NAD(P)-dependent oxidoreductase n=1 Tax=Holophaga foetida TaxID=35839 RepID=UPI0002472AAB|nr:hydroxyacid dehydrogenase [Holophaga foetida]
MKILLADPFTPELPARLAAFGELSEDLGELGDAEVLVVRSRTRVNEALLARAPGLRLVLRGGVGIDNIDLRACEARHIQVLNTPKASSIAVAELTMAFMLAVTTRLVEAHNAMREGRFPKKELLRTELYGKTLGLLGVGNVATEVARRALAFGMSVLGYDPNLCEHPLVPLARSLDELLSQCDVVSIHLPPTPGTRGFIQARVLARMKDGAILINTARSQCVVEQDLADALGTGKLRAYCTDVYSTEPPQPDSPILKAPNVYLTPHIGANTGESLDRIGDVLVAILQDYVSRKE